MEQVETITGERVGYTFLSVTGGHINCLNNRGNRRISSDDRIVSESDLIETLKIAKNFNLPVEKHVIHTYDRVFRIDNQRETITPLGQVASSFDAEVHLIYGDINRLETSCLLINELLDNALTDFIYSPVAAAEITLNQADKDRGVLLLDIGAGVTEYVLFKIPGCYHSGQITVGCDQIANDLSIGLKISIAEARKLLNNMHKMKASVLTKAGGADRNITIESLSGKRTVPISTIERIVELRLAELFEIIKADLAKQHGLEKIGCGVRLSGGGALIPEIEKLAQNIFKMPVSTASYQNVASIESELESPVYMTVLGLIAYGHKLLMIEDASHKGFWKSLRSEVKSIKNWLKGAIKF